MPLRNYARDALVQYVGECCNFNEEKTRRVLTTVVQQNRHFLVPFSLWKNNRRTRQVPTGFTPKRFSAKVWVEHHDFTGRSYVERLAEAYLLTSKLRIPDGEWTEELRRALEGELVKILQQKQYGDRQTNFAVVADDPNAGPIFRAVEARMWNETARYKSGVARMAAVLERGLPTVKCAAAVHPFYENAYHLLLSKAQLAGRFDVKMALKNGSGHDWLPEHIERAMSVLEVAGGDMNDYAVSNLFGALPEPFVRGEHVPSVEGEVWRIRTAEASKWKEALGELWPVYEQCEAHMRTGAIGTFSAIKRKRFNGNSCKDMVDNNLPRLCKMFQIERENF